MNPKRPIKLEVEQRLNDVLITLDVRRGGQRYHVSRAYSRFEAAHSLVDTHALAIRAVVAEWRRYRKGKAGTTHTFKIPEGES
jgi:hypothetical protein